MAFLSKINLGGTIYDIKDAGARKLIEEVTGGVDSLGTAASLNYAESVIAGNDLPTNDAIIKYVGDLISGVNSFEYEVVEALPTASADTMHKIYLVADPEAAAGNDIYEEWITIKNGETYSFEKIGDTNIGLDGYVPTTRTIAGLALSADITVDALKNALGLGALAYKNSVTGTVTAVTAVADAKYTPAGGVAVVLDQTSTSVASTGKFTPSGTVSGTAVTDGSIAVTAKYTSADATLTKGDYTPAGTVSADFSHADTAATLTKGDYTPAGTVTANFTHSATSAELTKGDYTPAGDVSVALSGGSFNAITSVGTAASFTEGEFTPASLTYGDSDAFAKEGLVGSVVEETLVLAAASTGTASVISAFSGGSKVKDTFVANTPAAMKAHNVGVQSASFSGTKVEGALVTGVSYDKAALSDLVFNGTLAEDVLVTGVTYGKASLSNLAFAGTKAEGALVTGVSYDKADIDSATFTGATIDIDATFAGTEGDLSVSGNYDKASVASATFTGTEATLHHDVTSGAIDVDITVS